MGASVELGEFRNSVALAVTDVAAAYTMVGPYSTVVVQADRNVHLRRDDGDATTADFLLQTGDYARVYLEKDSTLSFVLAAGETDGTLRITEATC